MDEQEIYLYFVQPDGGFLAQKLGGLLMRQLLVHPQPQIQPTMTYECIKDEQRQCTCDWLS
jgi:hypothetical protein